MFRTRKITGIVETPKVKALSEKFDELADINKQILSMNIKLSTDNEYFRQKQEEFDKKNKGVIQKLKDYWKGE